MKLIGYRATHRNRWLLKINKILDDKEFLLFEYYLDAMVWDLAHLKAGVFEVFFDEIAPIFDKSNDTIRDWHNGLLNKGFIQLVDEKRKLYTIKSPERYQFDGRKGGKACKYYEDEEANPTIEFLLQNVCFSPQKVGKIQQNTTNLASNDKKALISSNVECISNIPNGYRKVVTLKQKVRSPEEYKQMYKESGSQGLSPDDMRLADEVTHEEIVVENEKQEQEIIQLWFGGNRAEYKKACRLIPVSSDLEQSNNL